MDWFWKNAKKSTQLGLNMKNKFIIFACIAAIAVSAVSAVSAQESSEDARVPGPAKESGKQSQNHEDPNYGWSPGRTPTAKEIAEVEKQVAENPNDFQLVRKLGKGYFYRKWQADDTDAGAKAKQMLERALELKKDDPESLAFMGIVLSVGGVGGTDLAGRNAEQCFLQAEKIDPNNIAVLGLQLGINQRNARGVELAERMRTLPDFAELSAHGQQRAFLTLGWGAARKGDAKQARSFFQEGLNLDPTTQEAAMFRAELDGLK